MQFQNLKSYERRTLFSPLKHVKFKLSVNLKLFFFKNASCAISFDTIIAVFTDFKVGVKNVTVFDANLEIDENSNNCIIVRLRMKRF